MPSDLPVVTAGTLTGHVRLDGILDEPAWKSAGIIADLTQQSPKPGEATPYATEVRILADGGNLYFGITCVDPDPARIAVHTMQRDGNMSGDDTISIVLDTFHDHRTGYLFEVNAVGARLDGLISDPNADTASLDWDGIWDVRTQRTATGWTAEIVLPAQTIRFNRSTGQWGFNVQRYVARELLTLRWSRDDAGCEAPRHAARRQSRRNRSALPGLGAHGVTLRARPISGRPPASRRVHPGAGGR